MVYANGRINYNYLRGKCDKYMKKLRKKKYDMFINFFNEIGIDIRRSYEYNFAYASYEDITYAHFIRKYYPIYFSKWVDCEMTFQKKYKYMVLCGIDKDLVSIYRRRKASCCVAHKLVHYHIYEFWKQIDVEVSYLF